MKSILLAVVAITGCATESNIPTPPSILSTARCTGTLSAGAATPQRVDCSADFVDPDGDIVAAGLNVRASTGAIYSIFREDISDLDGVTEGTAQFSLELLGPPSAGMLSIAFELIDAEEYSSNLALTMVVVAP